jgi:hypothetical protein
VVLTRGFDITDPKGSSFVADIILLEITVT